MADADEKLLDSAHIDRSVLEKYYTIDADQPFAPGTGFRARPRDPAANGVRDFLNVRQGLQLIVGDVYFENDTFADSTGSNVLKLHFRLSGSGAVGQPGGQEEYPIEQHWCQLLLQPEGMAKREWFRRNQHEQSVTLFCSADFLEERLVESMAKLPEPVREFVEGHKGDFYVHGIPLRADMVTAASDLITSDFVGDLRMLHAEARSLELLLWVVEALIDLEATKDQPKIRLRAKEIEMLQHTREILEANFIEPPKIAELAQGIGTNEGKLMQGFKQLFGQTIFDYSQRLRMEHGKELLESTDLSITEIAFELGYDYSNNFTTAFKRHYGMTPRAARLAAKH